MVRPDRSAPGDTVVVARIGRPHGVQGEVSIEVRTDAPQARFVDGTVFATDPAAAGPLTVAGARRHQNGYLLRFAEVGDRGAAEALRGVLLRAAPLDEDDPDAFYDDDLIGLRAVLVDGRVLGEVVAVEHGPAQDLLVIAQTGSGLARIPFVAALVPNVSLAEGAVTLDPPGGLFDAVPATEA
jgi:16S rRNA processing protein RimM